MEANRLPTPDRYAAHAIPMALMAVLGACGGAPSDSPATEAPQAQLLQSGTPGCYHHSFSGAAAGQFGCGLLQTSGNFLFDHKLNEEFALQRRFFGDSLTSAYLFDECAPEGANAYASPERFILLGIWLVRRIIFDTGSDLPVAGVLAHEMAHRLQFENGWTNHFEPTVRRSELEADMWSGLYMAYAKRFAGAEIETYFRFIFSRGDYNFHDPGHHGTPGQRLAAGATGFEVARLVEQGAIGRDMESIHRVFANEVTRITSAARAPGADAHAAATDPSAGSPGSVPDGDQSADPSRQIDRDWIDGIIDGQRRLAERPALRPGTAQEQFPWPGHPIH